MRVGKQVVGGFSARTLLEPATRIPSFMNLCHPRFARLSQLVMLGAGDHVIDPVGRGKGAIYKVQSVGSS